MSWIRKKYTKVLEAEVPAGGNVWNATFSLIGGKNNNDLPNTYTL